MALRIDDMDRKILNELQQDAALSLDEIARRVGSSKTPVWNRIRKLREGGIIKQQTALLDAEALGFEACFFVLIRTSAHEAEWQAKFLKALRDRPEVQEAHRLAGDIDYILKVRVANARASRRRMKPPVFAPQGWGRSRPFLRSLQRAGVEIEAGLIDGAGGGE